MWFVNNGSTRNSYSKFQEMESKWKGGKEPEFSLKLPNSTAKAYNENFDGMKSNLRKGPFI